jgi:uroporphyrinogen-III synthase
MGQEVLLTLPALRSAPWLETLRRAGYRPRHWPLTALTLAPALDLHELHRRIAASVWTLLPSPGAVTLLMQALLDARLSWPGPCGIALIGPGSLQALNPWMSRLEGLSQVALQCPAQAPFDARALLALPTFQRLDRQGVLLLHRADGSVGWIRTLLERGARIEVRELYRQSVVSVAESEQAWMIGAARQQQRVPVSLASRGAAQALMQTALSLGVADWLVNQPVLTQHPLIAQSLLQLGFRQVGVHEPGVEPFIRSLRTVESRPS